MRSRRHKLCAGQAPGLLQSPIHKTSRQLRTHSTPALISSLPPPPPSLPSPPPQSLHDPLLVLNVESELPGGAAEAAVRVAAWLKAGGAGPELPLDLGALGQLAAAAAAAEAAEAAGAAEAGK